jgi:hypothetical protein
MHDQFSICRSDLADMPIDKKLQNGRDMVVKVGFAAFGQDFNDLKTSKISNNGDLHFR